MNVSVTVNNQGRPLSGLSNIIFRFWYDADGGAPTQDEFNNSPVTPQNGIFIVWDSVTGFGGLVANNSTGGSASWVRLTCNEPADMNTTQGTFWFNFTIGKVAWKTNGAAVWQIAAVANSTSFGEGFVYDAEGVTMYGYGEISIEAPAIVDWGIVLPGLDFADAEAVQSLGADVTYIVNGNYTQNVASSSNWTNATACNATLDSTGACNDPQEFSLKANVNGMLASAQLVNVAPGVAIASGTITGDGTTDGGSGNVESNNTLWLKLADTFEAATYVGCVTYFVAFE